MKSLAFVAALAAACIGALPAVAARPDPPPAPDLQPFELPVPADIVAAHPNGRRASLRAVLVTPRRSLSARKDEERVNCWRGYFDGDNSGPWGTEQENINPYWCGNGSVTRGLDSGWHWQSCSWFVSCNGESGVGTWLGCPYGCSSVGQQIVGHFHVWAVRDLAVDITIAYELYGSGGYWSYSWHN
jgi:hypothetical protein